MLVARFNKYLIDEFIAAVEHVGALDRGVDGDALIPPASGHPDCKSHVCRFHLRETFVKGTMAVIYSCSSTIGEGYGQGSGFN